MNKQLTGAGSFDTSRCRPIASDGATISSSLVLFTGG